jgi:hypothetical protein
MRRIISSIKELHKLLNVQKEFTTDIPNTYDVAHHIGLSINEEYELLNLMNERQRQEYLKRHLAKVIPLLAQMETLKEKIKLNGHFKNLAGFSFDL